MASTASEVTHSLIPVLDLADYMHGDSEALETLAVELRYALENIGFFYIV